MREIYHHGINGQKWGVRNGPPYPLGASDHSASEKKAGWRKSLDKKSESKHTKSSSSGGVDNSNRDSFHLTDEQKRIVRNVAIGAAVTAAILGTAYVGYKIKDSDFDKFIMENGHGKVTRLSEKLSSVPISQLSDKDFVISGKTQIQRIIGGKSVKSALAQEKIKDVLYATYEENDKNIYRHIWNPDKGLKKIAMTMTAKKDLVIPSERKRVEAFVNLIKSDPQFVNDLEWDLGHRHRIFNAGILDGYRVDVDNPQKHYKDFQRMLGDVGSDARKTYFNRIKQMGYNALLDDNDANAFSKKPIIILDAQNDVVIEGAKRVNALKDFIATMKITKFDVEHW